MSKVEALLELVQSRDDVAVVRKLLLKLATKGGFSSEGSANWAKARLGDLGKWGSGGTPLRSQGNYYAGGTIPWLVIGDLNDAIVTKAATLITPEGLENSSASLLPENTLLIAMYGSIGKMGITGIQCATNQAIAYCKPAPEKVTLWYLFYALKSIQDDLLGRGQGLAQKNISQTILKAWTIHLPPLAEQKRIVAKVDELMALCDRLEAQLKERDVKQAALAKAALAKFTEDPTPENLQLLFHPSFSIEPEALRRLLLNLATSGNLNEGKKSKPSIVSMDSLVGRKGLKNGLSPTSSATQTKYKCLALSSIKRNYVDCTEGKPIDIDTETAEPFLIQPSDVFIIRGNGSKDRVGIAGMATSSPGNVIFPDLFIRVSLPKELIDPEYFLCAWNSPSNREALMSLSTTTSGIWKVNQGHITSCKIPIPDLSEQRHIVKRVKEITSLIDQLEAQLEASRTTGEKLLEAMVAELTSA